MQPQDEYQIYPGSAESHLDFEAGLCVHILRAARLEIRALRIQILKQGPGWGSRVSPDILASLRPFVATLRDMCKHIVVVDEEAYLTAQAFFEERLRAEVCFAALVEDIQRRLTFLGTPQRPRTWSHIGWIQDNPAWPLALSRDEGHLILGAGIQGRGKTVLGSILAEASLRAHLPVTSAQIFPTAFVFFHIEEQDRLPQLLDGLKPNPTRKDLDILAIRLGVVGVGLQRLRLAIPETVMKWLMPRLLPYIDLGLEVMPIKVRLSQLGQPGLEAALGAESGARYIQRMLEDAQRQGKDLELSGMRHFINTAEDLTASMKRSAHARLDALKEVASPPDGPGLWEMVEPGVATVFYLGGPYVGRAHLLPLLVGLLNGLMMTSEEHGAFQRVIVVDEVNLLDKDEVAWSAFTRLARQVRHRSTTLVLLGQDLLCVPDELFGLAALVAVFELRNPRVWEHIKERVGALRGWGFDDVAALKVAEALLAVTETTDPGWQRAARVVKFRPLRCEHGGRTRAMV